MPQSDDNDLPIVPELRNGEFGAEPKPKQADMGGGVGQPPGPPPEQRLPKSSFWLVVAIILAIALGVFIAPWIIGIFAALFGTIMGIVGAAVGIAASIVALALTAFIMVLPALLLIALGYGLAVVLRGGNDKSGQ